LFFSQILVKYFLKNKNLDEENMNYQVVKFKIRSHNYQIIVNR